MKPTLATTCLAAGLLLSPTASAAVVSGDLLFTGDEVIDAVLTDTDPLTDDPGEDGWRAWNGGGLTGSDLKNSTTNSVGAATAVGTVSTNDASGGVADFDYAWVDGTNTTNEPLTGSEQSVVRIDDVALGEGVEIPVTVTGIEGTITLYVGARKGAGEARVLDAGDNVLYDATDESEAINTSGGDATQSGVYEFNYTGATIGEVLSIQWVALGGDDNPDNLAIAAVAERATLIPEPASLVLFGLGAALMVPRRRR